MKVHLMQLILLKLSCIQERLIYALHHTSQNTTPSTASALLPGTRPPQRRPHPIPAILAKTSRTHTLPFHPHPRTRTIHHRTRQTRPPRRHLRRITSQTLRRNLERLVDERLRLARARSNERIKLILCVKNAPLPASM